MPSNCSNDVQAVIAHFDAVAKNPKEVAALKAQFGLEDVMHYDDVTAARAYSMTTQVSVFNSSSSQESYLHLARLAT